MSAYDELVKELDAGATWLRIEGFSKAADRNERAIAAIRALEGERDALLGDPEGDTWWKVVIGDGAHTPSGEVASIKHMHPLMVKPIYEAHKGTAVADVIAGLLFAKSITENREQFLVKDANERRDEAEAARQSAEAKLEAVREALERIGNRDFVIEEGRGDFGVNRTRCPSCGHAWDDGFAGHHASDCALVIARQALASLDKEKAGG